MGYNNCARKLMIFLMFMATIAISAVASCGQSLTINGVGICRPSGMPEGLSGITYAGGNQYYVVDDSGAVMYPLTINLNTATGAISSASTGNSIILGGTDLEGIAYSPSGNGGVGSVYVSDETGPRIREYSLSGGQLSTLMLPSIYSNIRTNKSLESLTMRGDVMWTCNEEALSVDGPISTANAGTVVRLQKFTRNGSGNWNQAVQFAYNTLSWGGDSPFTSSELSGMSDLCLLPNGTLLVLERRLKGTTIPAFENNIYEIGTSNATDISAMPALSGATYTSVSKTLLWTGNFGLDDNFEGLCLGPQLDNGDWSLLMVSDGDGDQLEGLYSLRLNGNIPEPATLVLMFLGSGLLLVKKSTKMRHGKSTKTIVK